MSESVQSRTSPVNVERFQQYRKENLAYESSIYCASYFYFALAAEALLNAWRNEFASPFSNIMLVTAGVAIWSGIGLRRLDPNARTGAGIISIGCIALNWKSIIIHGYFLHLLYSSDASFIFSDGYRRAVKHTPETSPVLRWLPILLAVIQVLFTCLRVVHEMVF